MEVWHSKAYVKTIAVLTSRRRRLSGGMLCFTALGRAESGMEYREPRVLVKDPAQSRYAYHSRAADSFHFVFSKLNIKEYELDLRLPQ